VVNKALIAMAVAVALSCSPAVSGDGGEVEVDSTGLQSLVLDDLKGRPIDFAELVGKKVLVISFWGTFCKPCKSEMPFLQKMLEAYGDQGFEVVAISLDTPDTESGVGPFIDRNRYTFKVAVDRQSKATRMLNSKSVLPYLLIFDRAGNLVKKKDGFSTGDQPALEKLIRELVEKRQ
jgi:thiol-disulfide isomerase/thioredoxin